MTLTADEIIAKLALAPHPEGGFYRQTWIAEAASGARPAGTAIYFLLRDGGASHWHKVDATEIWFYHAGAPLVLSISETDAGPAQDLRLSGDLTTGAAQGIVPKDWWQAARTTGDWTLVSCTVTPAFQFEGFTLAHTGFDIPRG